MHIYSPSSGGTTVWIQQLVLIVLFRWLGSNPIRTTVSHLKGTISRLQLKCDGTRWRTRGEVKGKLANGVGTWEHGVSSITTADAQHTSAASSRLNCSPPPCRFKWTRPFRRKTKSGFCACAITFQTQSTNCCINTVYLLMMGYRYARNM